MVCKYCADIIENRRNRVNEVFCSHECFIDYDLSLELYEQQATFFRTRIGVLRQMKYRLYYLRRPHKLAEFDQRIDSYRQELELVYSKLSEV